MQDNTNQTNQKDPDNGGLNDQAQALELVRSIWWSSQEQVYTHA
jgi:hypothetical protein